VNGIRGPARDETIGDDSTVAPRTPETNQELPVMTDDDRIKVLQSIYEAFGAGDVPFILDRLTDDVAWDQDAPSYGVPIYEPRVGREGARAFFEVLGGLDITRFVPTNFLTGGMQVAVTIDLAATVKATGHKVEVLEIHLWTFGDDGKISRFFHCVDRHAFVVAYGAG
jgi:ketosteroid isomerase-like protein